MEEVKRIYFLLLHSTGLKIKVIAKELDLDKYYVADIMFSPDNNKYWYINDSSLWFAKEGAIQIEEEKKEDELLYPAEKPQKYNFNRFLQEDISESLREYLRQISKFRIYSWDETKELFKRYKNGDRKAFELIVKSQQRLVANISLLYSRKGAPLEDILQEGNIGLIKAIERFDYTQFRSLSNYAKTWIFQAISFSMTTMPFMVKIPINQLILFRKVRKFRDRFEQINGYPPSFDIIEIDDDIDFERLAFLNNYPDNPKDITILSSDLDVYESYPNQAEKIEEAEYNSSYVNSLLNGLKGREEIIVRLYYGIGVEPETLGCISDKLDLTRERTRQILVNAIRRMRKITKNIDVFDEIIISTTHNYDVKALNEATIGDYIEVPGQKQLGRVINAHMSHGERIFYVLSIADRKVLKIAEDGTILSDKKIQKQMNAEKSTPERIAFLKSLHGKNNKDKSDTKTQDMPKKQTTPTILDTKRRIPVKIVTMPNTMTDTAKVGDRILYYKRPATVVEKRTKYGFTRLIIRYDNGTYDNVPDDTNRYRII